MANCTRHSLLILMPPHTCVNEHAWNGGRIRHWAPSSNERANQTIRRKTAVIGWERKTRNQNSVSADLNVMPVTLTLDSSRRLRVLLWCELVDFFLSMPSAWLGAENKTPVFNTFKNKLVCINHWGAGGWGGVGVGVGVGVGRGDHRPHWHHLHHNSTVLAVTHLRHHLHHNSTVLAVTHFRHHLHHNSTVLAVTHLRHHLHHNSTVLAVTHLRHHLHHNSTVLAVTHLQH